MDETVYKRSNKGKEIKKEQDSDILKLKSGNMDLLINKNLTIGRDMGCSIRIDDPLVSRKHALIEFVSDRAFIKDLGSTNATYVNKNPLKPGEQKRLRKGDIIKIGKAEIVVN